MCTDKSATSALINRVHKTRQQRWGAIRLRARCRLRRRVRVRLCMWRVRERQLVLLCTFQRTFIAGVVTFAIPMSNTYGFRGGLSRGSSPSNYIFTFSGKEQGGTQRSAQHCMDHCTVSLRTRSRGGGRGDRRRSPHRGRTCPSSKRNGSVCRSASSRVDSGKRPCRTDAGRVGNTLFCAHTHTRTHTHTHTDVRTNKHS